MIEAGRILLADDEELFAKSTAQLLSRQGYHCDCAEDADTALGMLRTGSYDLLISDIKMPGNVDLEFIKLLPADGNCLPVILVTAYPSLASAVESVRLPVVSYMVKPLDFDELLDSVRAGMQVSSVCKAVKGARRRLHDWDADLTKMAQLVQRSRMNTSLVTVGTFLDLTLSNIVGALSDMRNVTETVAAHQSGEAVCHLLECPRPAALVQGLREAVTVLEKTKRSFKSKELGQLRQKLETLVQETSQGQSLEEANDSQGD